MTRGRILCLAAPPGSVADIDGSVRRPCIGGGGHMVWVSPATQGMLGSADPICDRCLNAELEERRGAAVNAFLEAFGGEVGGTRQADGSWLCACGRPCADELELYMHRRYDHGP